MMQNRRRVRIFAIGLVACAASAQPRPVDAAKSTMTVRVSKSGVFSAFGHNHEISAPIAEGTVDANAHKVELRVKAAALKVRDPGTSEKDLAEIQKTMLGPDALDAERHQEIVFRSTSAERAGSAWRVQGTLTLHGESRPVTVEVREQRGHYAGSARLKQTEFGMKPVKVAGGTVSVKDEVRIEFDIQLAR
jgi:polyisoprenoid-binding protein YceI